MAALTDRSKQVLQYLLRVGEPLTTSEIASRFSLTPVQVRYCWRSIDPWLRARGAAMVRKPRVGIRVEAAGPKRDALLAELRGLRDQDVVLAPADRQRLLCLQLLTSHEPLRFDALCRGLGISRTSLFRGIGEARTWLEGRGLRLVSSRGRGLSAVGEEASWRRAAIALLTANLSQGILVAACVVQDPGAIEQSAANAAFLREAAGYLRSLDLHRAEQLTTLLERRLRGRFVDDARIGLILHIALMLRRVLEGKTIGEGQEPGAGQLVDDEVDAVRSVIQEIAADIQRDLPESEQRFLLSCLADAMWAGFVAAEPSERHKAPSEGAAYEMARRLAREAARYLQPGLARDRELVHCLALELAGVGPSAPGVGAVQDDKGGAPDTSDALHGFVWRVLRPILLQSGYAPTARVMGLIAQHLGTSLGRLRPSRRMRRVWVVCGAHLATARNLRSRLELNLPELEILGVTSAFEIARDPEMLSGADAVISTIPLEWMARIPVVIVSPALSGDDLRAIGARLDLIPAAPSPIVATALGRRQRMPELLSPETIRIGAPAGSWEELVEQAGALLLEVGAIWPSYIGAMKEMIQLYGPYMVVAPGAALLHAAPEMGAKRLAMGLVIPRPPVSFGHPEHDPVRLALALSSADYEAHVDALEEAMRLLTDAPSVEALAAATDAGELLETLGERLREVGAAG